MPAPTSDKTLPFDEEEERTRAGRVASDVLRRIVELELAPGHAITEADLAAEQDIAKPTAREALQHVAMHGLVTPVRGSGYVVRSITLADARHLLPWWRVILVESAAFAAEQGLSERVREHLPSYRQAREEALEQGTGLLDHFTDTYFAMLTGNPYPARTLYRIAFLVQRLVRFAAEHGATFEPAATWDDVLEAIEQGDAKRVRELSRQRVDAVEGPVLDILVRMAVDDQANLAG